MIEELEDGPVIVPDPKPSKKPDISHLDDAINEDGMFIPLPGERVVIERCSVLSAAKPWLGTYVYTVRDIDYDTGNLKLWNDELGQFAGDNYIDGVLGGSVYKLPPRKGPITMRKRRVSKKLAKIHEQMAFAKESKKDYVAPSPDAPKKGKGRPKGSKNKPKVTS